MALAPLLAAPAAAGTQTSQLLGGHVVDVIGEQGDWLRVAGADAYSGWVHRGYLSEEPYAGNGTPTSGWLMDATLSLGCTARSGSGAHLRLPLGAHVPARAVVEAGETMSLAERRAGFPLSRMCVLDSADRFFPGTPYVWGGVTPWGADCSGFVQSLFALHGLPLPRDAWQQAEQGTLVPDRDAIEPGDLVFFCAPGEPRMTHVAIAVDRDVVIHLSVSRGGYAVDRLSAGDQISRRLGACYRFARRLLGE